MRGGEVPRAQLGAPGQVRETLKLRRRDVWLNLAVMVGLPYIKRKLDEGYDVHAAHTNVLGPSWQSREEPPPDASVRQRFLYYYKWFLRKVYPSVNGAYYFAILAFNLAYLFDSSKFHSPFLWLIGSRVRRMGDADHKAIELAAQSASNAATAAAARPGQGNSVFNPRTMARTVGPKLLGSLRVLLPTSIFALKFLEWWHASDFARQLSRKAAEGLELPPPAISGLSRLSAMARAAEKPSPPSSALQAADNEKSTATPTARSKPSPPISSTSLLPILTVSPPTPATSHLCPICGDPIVNPTASPYGYVYCYTCIHKWVAGEHERQVAFMEGNATLKKNDDDGGEQEEAGEGWGAEEGSREGHWENGKGRCAVSAKRILGGTEVLRRVLV